MFPRQAFRRRNLLVAALIEGFWACGVWLSHPFTIIPVFLMRLGASTTAIGFISALRALGSGAVVMYMGMLTAHRRFLAPTFRFWHYVALLPYIGLSVLALVARSGAIPSWALQSFAILLAVVSSALLGGQLPVYFALLSRLTTERERVRFFGVIFAVGPLVGLLGPGFASIWLKGGEGDFLGYAVIFGVSAALFVVGTTGCFFLREIHSDPVPRRTLLGQLSSLVQAWKGHAGLRRYLKARMWLAGGILVVAYLATYARHEAAFSERSIALLGYFMLVTQGAGSFALGRIGSSRRASALPGQRELLFQWLSMAFVVLALFFGSLAPAFWAAPVIATAAGVIIAVDLALQPNILMSLGPAGLRRDIVALAAMVFMPFALVVPPVCGLLIETFGHRPVFFVGGVFGLYGLRQLYLLLCARRQEIMGKAA